MDYKELFHDLLDAIEQCPHPMAEDIWNEYHEMVESEGDE
jgi:hypothetical protein